MSHQGTPSIWVIIPAAGVGRRMLSDRPKQYLTLCGMSVIENTLQLFTQHEQIRGVVVSISDGDPYWPEIQKTLSNSAATELLVAPGGAERCHSVLNGLDRLSHVAQDQDWVMVHDAARPCLQPGDLLRLIESVTNSEHGGLLGTRVRDTMKRSDDHGVICSTESRENLWHALTPQMFRYGGLKRAYETAITQGVLPTDEAAAIEGLGHRPIMVEGHADNIKITQPEDLLLAEFFIRQRESQS